MKKTCPKACVALILYVTTAIGSPAQTFNKLVDFFGTNGANPEYVSLVQGADGGLYGTTTLGGTNPASFVGTIFKMTPGGTLTTLYSFCSQGFPCPDGDQPVAGLVLATDGNFYGTTTASSVGLSTVFKVTPSGTLTTLYNFCPQRVNCVDGVFPKGRLVQGTDGNLYGTTSQGGVNCPHLAGCGTVFKVTPAGILTTLYNFCNRPGCIDGSTPYAGLIQANDGNFYGTTTVGGSSGNCLGGCGTIFKMTPSGALTTLHSFDYSDGVGPVAALIQAADGNFYGTTAGEQLGDICFPCGTVFKLTSGGTLTTLQSFSGGYQAYAGLVQGSDGNFYGTTVGDQACGGTCGTIFEITPDDAFTTLYTFCVAGGCGVTGSEPWGGLTQATNGRFYGTTYTGGADQDGTVFTLSTGLGPFVAFVRNPTKAGQMFGILGQGFTGTTNVSLNGTSIPFTIKSDTLLTATIPVGGTTGSVTVTTPTGTLTSNVPFRVLPQLLSFTPTSGPVGTQVTITGVSLTQANGVGFGDYTPAPFTVNSDTQVTATVPTGAKTGPVGVQTQGGIAISTQVFTVPQ